MSSLRFPTGRSINADHVSFSHRRYEPNNFSRQQAGGRRGFSNFRRNKDVYSQSPPDGKTVSLYMPSTIPGMQSKQSWNSTGNTFGSPLRRSLTRAAATLLGTAPRDGGGPSSYLPTADDLGDMFKYELYGFIGSQVTGTTINEYLTLTGGAIFNPNVEMLYDGLDTRGFQFDFFLVSNNKEDTQAITDIVMEFKKYSSPSTGESNGNWLTVPHLWDISYKGSRGSSLKFFNKFKPSVITAMNVQDNAGMNYHNTYTDGSPIVTALSIQFAEVDIITREDHDAAAQEGYVRGY